MKYPSMDLTYEWGRNTPEQLSQIADALDTKIMNIFTASCLIISVITALKGNIKYDITIVPFVVALVTFIVILVCSLRSIRPQWLYSVDSPIVLREDYWSLEMEEAKEKYWNYVEQDFVKNQKIVKAKGTAILWLVPSLGLETIALLIWLFL